MFSKGRPTDSIPELHLYPFCNEFIEELFDIVKDIDRGDDMDKAYESYIDDEGNWVEEEHTVVLKEKNARVLMLKLIDDAKAQLDDLKEYAIKVPKEFRTLDGVRLLSTLKLNFYLDSEYKPNYRELSSKEEVYILAFYIAEELNFGKKKDKWQPFIDLWNDDNHTYTVKSMKASVSRAVSGSSGCSFFEKLQNLKYK